MPADMLTPTILLAGATLALFLWALRTTRRLSEITARCAACREAERQLSSYIENSPAAVVIADVDGHILRANAAAGVLLGAPEQALPGRRIETYVPSLGGIGRIKRNEPVFRSTMECQAWRRDGKIFTAHVCFAVYDTSYGRRVGVMFTDAADWEAEPGA